MSLNIELSSFLWVATVLDFASTLCRSNYHNSLLGLLFAWYHESEYRTVKLILWVATGLYVVLCELSYVEFLFCSVSSSEGPLLFAMLQYMPYSSTEGKHGVVVLI